MDWFGLLCGEDVVIGEESRLYPRVTIYPECMIGSRVIIHAGVVIGSDGFGFARDGSVWIKIPQTGRVRIGDDCEIGANTTIDRGAIEDTVIGAGCKLDNQIQVAHNVRIGEGCAIAACVGIAGSAVIGNHCQIGGGAGILGHLEIADHTIISAMSLVTRSITKPGFYTGVFPLMPNRDWEHAAAGLRRQVRLRGQSRLTLGASPSHSSSPGPDSGLGADSDHEATRYER
ncbi:MAG: UDP-3-O-(3-hydroxymyristoyl)glucosamine N-acyltransferase [Betaproteobacteria bacterium]|nr:UDP-3-O-(3-hydroxymyristoyl)glucosamine N-acyltransferase [Betaproteobacteria bacterium]